METQTSSSPRILVVDDNATNVEYLVKVLVRAGYATIQAQSAEQALKLASQEHVDLLLADIMMPEVDGFALVQAIRKLPEYANLPVIMCSAAKEKQYVLTAAKLNVQGYVLKPIDRQILLQRIATVLPPAVPVAAS
jgi:twitching motility two-component system response regulator PilH